MKQCHLSLKGLAVLFFIAMYLSVKMFSRNCNLNNEKSKGSYVTLFWSEFFAWWAQITNEKTHLPDSVLLYGPVNLSKHNQVLSLALLVAKYFICKCNLAEDPSHHASWCI